MENTKEQIEETFDDISSCFINIETFRVFAISKRGFGLTDTQLAKVTDDHTEDYKQRRAILQLWRKSKGNLTLLEICEADSTICVEEYSIF